jgi:hypothetical protein
MTIKNVYLRVLCELSGYIFLLFFLLPVPFLQAQNEETNYIQRLTWTGDEYARHYEVVIEKEEVGEYRELLKEFTTALFIEVPLLPGKYRCMVITYDFLNQAGEASEWKYIEVLTLSPGSDDTLPDLFLSDSGIESPDDKTSEFKTVQLAGHQKKVDIFLGAAWMPSFKVSDKGNHFGRDISLAGFAARFAMASAKPNYFHPGLELAASYNFFGTDSNEQSVVHLLTFGINLSALKWFPGDRTALTFRLGAGYSAFLPDDKGAVHTNMGISFLLIILNQRNRFRLYLETGLDYTHWFKSPPASCFRPWLGLGWKF